MDEKARKYQADEAPIPLTPIIAAPSVEFSYCFDFGYQPSMPSDSEIKAVADACGLTRQGVRRLLKEESSTLSVSTLEKLLAFFATEGMSITVNDLFEHSVTFVNPPLQTTLIGNQD